MQNRLNTCHTVHTNTTSVWLKLIAVLMLMVGFSAKANNWDATNVSATLNSPTSVTVSWDPPVESAGLTNYQILRNGVLVSELSTNTFTYLDSNLPASTTYFYAIGTCYVQTGCQASPAAYITIPAAFTTNGVSQLTIYEATASSISLAWTVPSDANSQTEYKVYRAAKLIGTTKNNFFLDNGLQPLNAFSYQVIRCQVGGVCMTDGPRIIGSTTKAPPKSATGLTAQVFGTNVDLSWTASQDSASISDYKIYRSGTLIGSTKYTTYSDTNLKENTTYTYKVLTCFSDSTCDESGTQVNATTENPTVTISNGTSTLGQKNAEMVLKSSGATNKLTLSVQVKIPESKSQVGVFVAFVIDGYAKLMNDQGGWSAYGPGKEIAYQIINSTPATIEIPIIKDLDLRSLRGGTLIIGLGRNGSTVPQLFNDLLENQTYKTMYTVE
jgi:hypothetical protein